MGFKLVKVEKKESTRIDNGSFISFLLEDHNNKASKRSLNLPVDDNSIPGGLSESKKEFDFFQDDAIDATREEVLSDLEVSTIKKQTQIGEVIVDRRRSRTK